MKKTEIHVLVVEDNPGDYLLIEENLHDKFENVTINHCTDYQSVLETFKSEIVFSIILLDFNLPDLDGIDLVDKIQSLAKGAPIIILTGYSNIKLARESLAKGVSDFLIKDEINAEILYKSIVYALERKKFMYEQNKSKEVYQHLFNFTPQPLWLYDAECLTFLDVNEATVRKYGYTREEFLQMTIKDIRPQSEIDNVNQQIEKPQAEREEAYAGIFTHQLKSGEKIQVEIYSGDMEYNGRKARIVLSNDITDKLNHLQTIEGQNMKLKKIAWTQSHVVRAPISRILGILNLIEMLSYDSKEMPFLLQQLRVSTDEMDTIVREIVNESQLINFREEQHE